MSPLQRRSFGASLLTGASLTVALTANAAEGPRWAVSEFLDVVSKDGIERVVFSADSKELLALDSDGARHKVEILPTEVPELVKQLRTKSVPFAVQAAPTNDGGGLAAIAGNLLFPLVLLGGLFFLNRNKGGMGGPGGPMGMLQNKSKIQMEPETGVTFEDVAGCDASKLELEEVVDFLSNADKYNKVGAQAPRGVMLEGPPGTGKTLLARAVAGEAGVPFISCSGSEFVEMFVGVGASRIRSLFADAKKNAPCIIFIDDDARVPGKAVHLREDPVQGLFPFVVGSEASTAGPLAANRVDLVNKNDARRVLLRVGEQASDARRTHTDEHLDELTTRTTNERDTRFARNSSGKQCFTSPRRPFQHDTSGRLRADLIVFFGVRQKVDNFLQLQLGSITPRHVIKRHARLGLHLNFTFRLKHAHGPAGAAHAAHAAHAAAPSAEEEEAA